MCGRVLLSIHLVSRAPKLRPLVLHTWVSNDRACWRSCAQPAPVEVDIRASVE